MYANLNTTEKLIVEKSDKPGFRFRYRIVNKEMGGTILTRYCNRKFVAATVAGSFFGRIENVQAHQSAMQQAGAAQHVSSGFYCYLEDATAFKPGNVVAGPQLAYSLNKTPSHAK